MQAVHSCNIWLYCDSSEESRGLVGLSRYPGLNSQWAIFVFWEKKIWLAKTE